VKHRIVSGSEAEKADCKRSRSSNKPYVHVFILPKYDAPGTLGRGQRTECRVDVRERVGAADELCQFQFSVAIPSSQATGTRCRFR